jgi:TrmH RNA methyltransferase
MLKYLVDKKLAYHMVDTQELDNISKATHHEGIVLLVKTKPLPSVKDLMTKQGHHMILALEEVENPHNLGAIIRSAAHFGVSGIIYQAKVPVANSAAAIRTAEGGAESVPAIHVSDWNEVLDLAKNKKFKTFATSSHEGKSLFETEFPEKSLVFMGAEGKGLSEKLLKKMNELISIPGTGNVESLNVSNATTAILTEWFRQS